MSEKKKERKDSNVNQIGIAICTASIQLENPFHDPSIHSLVLHSLHPFFTLSNTIIWISKDYFCWSFYPLSFCSDLLVVVVVVTLHYFTTSVFLFVSLLSPSHCSVAELSCVSPHLHPVSQPASLPSSPFMPATWLYILLFDLDGAYPCLNDFNCISRVYV